MTSPTSTTVPVPVLRILLPFACGYFLSYLYRSVNAVIATDLTGELQLDATDLGLLTSVYFLTFALFQLPLGMLLDRFGPRRVESVLLLLAAGGATVFALSEQHESLILGRALIGLGVSACLMASFKATASWFPAERRPAMNSWIMTAGGMGALMATRPVEIALGFTDWRGVMLALAVLTVAAAVFLFFTVPDKPGKPSGGLSELLQGVATIYRSAFFWRVVPLVVLSQAPYLAIQGLWAAPWLRDVAGMQRTDIANRLFWLAATLVIGYMITGQLASYLAKRGISMATTVVIGLSLFMLAQLGLVLNLVEFDLILWLAFGFFGSVGIITFPILAQRFEEHWIGRVNTCANVLVFGSAFAMQWGIGAIVNLWPQTGGGYQPIGYQVAFGLCLLLQVAALIWFIPVARNKV